MTRIDAPEEKSEQSMEMRGLGMWISELGTLLERE
jgi:hypothetical protein